MNQNNMSIAQSYYTAMAEKNIEGVGKYLHSNVHFISPMGEVSGKEAYLESVKKFMNLFETYTVRAECSSQDQVMLVYDVDFFPPFGNCATAALITFQDDLIIKIELFFDGRPFEKRLV